jgi:hypothetical protein
LVGLFLLLVDLTSIMGEVGQVINQIRVTIDNFHWPGLSGLDVECSGNAENPGYVLGARIAPDDRPHPLHNALDLRVVAVLKFEWVLENPVNLEAAAAIHND